MPLKTAAALAYGLPDDSRSKRAISKQPAELKILLLAAICDRLSILIWQNTKDAQRGKNKPTMLLDLFTQDKAKDKLQTFASGADFEAARAKLLG